MRLVDSHCHLDLLDLSTEGGKLEGVIKRAQENGVEYILNVCVSIADFPVILKTAEGYSFVGTSVGLHPNEQDEEIDEKQLIALAQHPKVVAIGETGLDYFRSTGDLEWQRDRFRAHISAAKQLKLPLIVHTRDAKEDTMRILREEKADEVGGVMHCFTEDLDAARLAMDLNFDISFSGIVTFKSAVQIQEVAKRIPIERILIETDSPYLAPVPYRGKANEPAFVRHTAEYIADMRGMKADDFAAITTENFFKRFKGAARPHV